MYFFHKVHCEIKCKNKYILMYHHKFLSVLLSVNFKHISRDKRSNYESIYKDILMFEAGQKDSKVQAIAFNINFNYHNIQLSFQKLYTKFALSNMYSFLKYYFVCVLFLHIWCQNLFLVLYVLVTLHKNRLCTKSWDLPVCARLSYSHTLSPDSLRQVLTYLCCILPF